MSAAATATDEERSQGRATARRALELAGRALDPNLGAPDPALARLLLEQAIAGCARAGAAEAELAAAGEELAAAAPTIEALRRIEARVAKIERGLLAATRASWSRRRRLFAWLLGPVLGIGLVVAIPVARGWTSRGLGFVTSSASSGFAKEGKLGHPGGYGVLFHTRTEKEPWVEIDLEREREISSITVENRSDCCTDRAVPLSAEIAGEDRQFREVGRQVEDFQSWTLEVPPGTRARWLRLSAQRTTMLHLQEIRVR